MVFLAALVLEADSLDKFKLTDEALGFILTLVNSAVLFGALGFGWVRHRSDERVKMAARMRAVKIEDAASFTPTKVSSRELVLLVGCFFVFLSSLWPSCLSLSERIVFVRCFFLIFLSFFFPFLMTPS
jgi:hypothetical protein